MKKLCIITTMSSSINNWIKPFLNAYHQRGVDVTIVCNMTEEFKEALLKEFPFVHPYPIPFPRGMSVGASLKSIAALVRLFRKNKFDMVQYSTPNASMYSSVASFLTRIPVRLYCQWGMIYVTRRGLSRIFFEAIERMVCLLSTQIQPDSIGNLEFCRRHKLYSEKKSCVIWNGSAKGLDLSEYDITRKEEYAAEIRARYNLKEEDRVIGFVGRLGREKGCNELFRAFQKIKGEFPTCKLLFVGPIEKEETIEPELLDYFRNNDDIIKTDRVPDVPKHMAAMEVFILPSHREGFGMSVIEASAMGIPVVTTQYPGPSSAMVEGVTGVSIPIGDTDAIYTAVSNLLQNKELAMCYGASGRKYVEKNYDRKVFIEKYIENRMRLFGETTC